MQHVELAEWHASGAHVLQRGLILVTPGVGEGEPIEMVASGSENALGLARDAGSKIDQSAEDVEEQRLDRHGGLVGQNQLSVVPAQAGSHDYRLWDMAPRVRGTTATGNLPDSGSR